MINFDPKQVVQSALAHGLASIKPKPEGVFGPKQRYQHRPQLAGLSGPSYHKNYMRLIRHKPLEETC